MVHSAVAPQGLELVHVAATTVEAEMLRDLLGQAGFHPEYVPAGHHHEAIGGNDEIYVPADELEEARAFLAAYTSSAESESNPEKERERRSLRHWLVAQMVVVVVMFLVAMVRGCSGE